MSAGSGAMARAGWSADAAALHEALAGGGPWRPEVVRSMVRAVGEDPPEAAWHPTGFLVLELSRRAGGVLRLHVWPSAERWHGQPCWPVHDHAWDLGSHVLVGQVGSRRVVVRDEPEGASRLYAVEYVGGHRSRMRRSERRVSVEEMPLECVGAGERYVVPAGVFHASAVEPGQLAATVVVTRSTGRPHPWVVGPSDGPECVRVERPVVEGERVREVLAEVLAAV